VRLALKVFMQTHGDFVNVSCCAEAEGKTEDTASLPVRGIARKKISHFEDSVFDLGIFWSL